MRRCGRTPDSLADNACDESDGDSGEAATVRVDCRLRHGKCEQNDRRRRV